MYSEPLEGGNQFTCSRCHALTEPAADGFIRPGHPIGDASHRPTYKGGTLTDFRSAVNTCVTGWMNADAFEADDRRWLALEAFLEDQAPAGESPAVDLQIIAPPTELSGGDSARGQDIFNGRCAVCHAIDAIGTQVAPPLRGGSVLESDYIARRVRTSGPIESSTYSGLTGGIMPFWGADRLSDDELRDVISFVHAISQESAPDAGMVSADGGIDTDAGPEADSGPTPDAGASGCPSTHARVGQTATLITRFHRVEGTVTIVDDCTLRIDNFGYDGTGIDVRFYGGLAGAYSRGFGMGDNLLQGGGYLNDTLTFTLPEGRTLDDLDGVSIWCVPAGASFGDGLFE